MLVSTMTDEEVYKEIVMDYQESISKMEIKFSHEYAKERKKKKIDRKRDYPKVYKWVSSKNNIWLLILSKLTDFKSYKGVKHTGITLLTYYYNNKSFRVVTTIPNEYGVGTEGISIFNGHFFKRYAERTGQKFTDPLKTVQIYFINNKAHITKGYEKDGVIHSLGVCREGLALGKFIRKNIVVNNTFITKDLMFEDQKEEEEKIVDIVKDKIKELLNENTFEFKTKLEYDCQLATLLEIQ